MRRGLPNPTWKRAAGVAVVLALCLKISLASLAVAAPRVVTGDPDKDIFAALAQICTSQGGTFLPKEGGDGKSKHQGAANECPLCSAFVHAALPSAAIEIPEAPAARVTLTAIHVERTVGSHTGNVQARAPPITVSV